MLARETRRGRRRTLLALGLAGCAIAGCSGAGDGTDSSSSSSAQIGATGDRLSRELADAFRVDLSSVDVAFDWYPGRDRVDGSAELRFTMRAGEETPIFHFNPLRGTKADEREMLSGLQLDDEALDPADDADLRIVRTARGGERAYEIQRKIDDDSEHTLEVEWSMPKPFPPKPGRPWFFQTFDDTQGPGNEIDSPFPTISSPDELARHTIDLRVHSAGRYTALGSGSVEQVGAGEEGIQEWRIDSGREISSSTMFFAAVPSAKVDVGSFEADGVEVELVTNRPAEDARRAEQVVRDSFATLTEDFGPFPVDRVSILMTRWGSGMEYYGAVRTGLGALEHEMGHMYFGTTLVNRTWRDTWWDEAAVQWWQGHERKQPVPARFERPFGEDRPPAAPGFDTAAYGSGTKVFEAIARELGGDEELIELLARISAEHRFEPFTTADFIDAIVGFDDSVDRAQLERWMLGRD